MRTISEVSTTSSDPAVRQLARGRLRVAFLTAGCRLNQSETDSLRAVLQEGGAKPVDLPGEADVCFVNTCTVTATADRSSIQLVRRACRQRPKPRVVVLGCLAERAPAMVGGVDGVDEIWGNERKQRAIAGQVPLTRRSRATLKIQDGCASGCAFCVVSRLRGDPRSTPITEVCRQVSRLVASGFREIVLTGLNLGSYGREAGSSLAGLLGELVKVDNRFRIRLASLEPDTVGAELLEALGNPRVCPHFHLPLQSGSSRLLAAMGRGCDAGHFEEIVGSIRRVRPDATLGTDLIVGLPGEEDDDFAATATLIERLEFSYLHVFPFSPRPGTPANCRRGLPTRQLVRARVERLRRLSTALKKAHERSCLGQVRTILVERQDWGLTDNYLRVRLEPGEGWDVGEMVDAELYENDHGLVGRRTHNRRLGEGASDRECG